MTANQIASRLADVPPATLYRHLRTLVNGHVLAVTGVRPVRAVNQKIYALADHAANIGPDDYRVRRPADHLRYFTTFLGSVRTDFQRYLLEHPRGELGKDGVAYYHIPLNLTDAEHRHLLADLKGLLRPLTERSPGGIRRRRLVTIIAMPGSDSSSRPPGKPRRDGKKAARANGQ